MIFGKDDCPHTQKAISDFKEKHRSFIYINVDKDPHGLKKLLEYSNDQYIVPVIVNVDEAVSYTHLREHETDSYIVCPILN